MSLDCHLEYGPYIVAKNVKIIEEKIIEHLKHCNNNRCVEFKKNILSDKSKINSLYCDKCGELLKFDSFHKKYEKNRFPVKIS